MSLGIPRTYAGGQWQSNINATPSATPGVAVDAHASGNTKGAWVDLFSGATTTYDSYGFWLFPNDYSTAATITSTLLDIALGESSETIIVSNYQIGSRGTTAAGGLTGLWFPIFIPKGSKVTARCQSVVPGNTGFILIALESGSGGNAGQLFSGCEDIGTNTADSGGTAVTAGASGAETASPVNIGSTTGKNYGAIMLGICGNNTVMNAKTFHWELTVGGFTLAEWLVQFAANENMFGMFPPAPIRVSIPSGTQLVARGECSTTSPESQDISFYGFY